ncbi:hypothetical protein Xen7305DRAFT_00021110 [Xenococcus sp. PCC 7305]|uniref:slr1601 family putative cell division protein n=1 Tax=Xenococcus sp. PCC 7305 TaxID=102125 RepID=UPI0002ABA82E|nr:hypothetical protein [Xenococcus sp. PCC 7305]ELS02397.1 hypothetical protein Xen7305DRAFT_00021110 [Xenococcus sp. PCC 7305]
MKIPSEKNRDHTVSEISQGNAPVRKTRKYPLQQGLVAEISLKLFFSFVIGAVAVISVMRLVPYHFSQKAKLKEIQSQVEETERRVEILREQMNRNFDSEQTPILMEEYSPNIAPNRSRVFWKEDKEEPKQ